MTHYSDSNLEIKRPMTARTSTNWYRQRGAALVTALIFLLILTLIGITAARLQTAQEGMARNENNHQLALQYAEAALRNAQATLPHYQATDAFSGDDNGLYELSQELTTNNASVADNIDWNNPGTKAMTYTGPSLANAPAPAQTAQIIIEAMPPVTPQKGSLADSRYPMQSTQVFPYRITAHARGADKSASATLQTIIE